MLFHAHHNLWDRYYSYLNFTGENTKHQSSAVNCTRSHIPTWPTSKGQKRRPQHHTDFPLSPGVLLWISLKRHSRVRPHLYPSHCKFRNSMCMPASHLYFRFLPCPLGNWSLMWISILIPFLRYLFIGEVGKVSTLTFAISQGSHFLGWDRGGGACIFRLLFLSLW